MCCKSTGGQFEKERLRTVKHPTETIVATMWMSTCICIDQRQLMVTVHKCTLVLELTKKNVEFQVITQEITKIIHEITFLVFLLLFVSFGLTSII